MPSYIKQHYRKVPHNTCTEAVISHDIKKYEAGKLTIGKSKKKVKKLSQAQAIALNQARRKCE